MYIDLLKKKTYAKENDIPVNNGFFFLNLNLFIFKPNKQRTGLCLEPFLSSTNRTESGRAEIESGPLLLQVTIQ